MYALKMMIKTSSELFFLSQNTFIIYIIYINIYKYMEQIKYIIFDQLYKYIYQFVFCVESALRTLVLIIQIIHYIQTYNTSHYFKKKGIYMYILSYFSIHFY